MNDAMLQKAFNGDQKSIEATVDYAADAFGKKAAEDLALTLTKGTEADKDKALTAIMQHMDKQQKKGI